MSTDKLLILGAAAGFTIFLGLPLGRVRDLHPRLRAAFAALATGILIFLLWDVLSHGVEPVKAALDGAVHHGTWLHFAALTLLLAVGFGLGYLGLVQYDSWTRSRRVSKLVGPGAAAIDEYAARSWLENLTDARRLALLIAVGIGLHNFGEGLAIGQSAASGQITLALVLVIGFGLHNATEGFGIVGPLGGDADRPSWRFLLLLGLIGGGPTFAGTVVGNAWVNTTLEVAFFALAAGSILYVVIELLNVCRRYTEPTTVAWMLFAGLVLGFGTDLVLTGVGA